MTLLIILNALMWAFLPALITSYVTWKVVEAHSATARAELSSRTLLRAAEIFFAWLLLFGVGFGVLLYANFKSVEPM